MILAALGLAVAAAAIALLTLLCGFGLGTLLLPAFALIFPVEVAVAATAVVHGLNNLLKLVLLGRHAVGRVVVAFGLPALGASFLGALVLAMLARREPWARWRWGPLAGELTAVRLIIGLLILGFAAAELLPRLPSLRARARWLPVGGLAAGFAGGLSGHQGALRAAFLTPLGLPPRAFVATQAVAASLVDAARLAVCGAAWLGPDLERLVDLRLVAAATAGAFAGTVGGARLLPRVTVPFIRRLTGWLLVLVGGGLAAGLL